MEISYSSGDILPLVVSPKEITGTAPTAQIRRVSDGYYLNFSTNAFQASAGTAKTLSDATNYWGTTHDLTGLTTDETSCVIEYTIDGEVWCDDLALNIGGGGGTAPTVQQIRQEMDANSTQLAAIIADIADLPALVGVPIEVNPDTATRIVGSDQGGTVASLAAEDGTYFATGEVNSGTLLEVELSIASSDTAYTAGSLSFRGYYEGGAGHLVYGYRYDYILAAYESTPIITMQTRTTPAMYTAPMSDDRYRNGSGAMKFKFVHSAGTGIVSHRLYLDFFKWVLSETNAEQLAALAAIRAQTDRLQFNAPGNDVRASVLHNYVDGTLTLGEALTGIFARLCGKARGGGTATIEFLRHLSTRVALRFTADNKGNRSNVDEDLGA